MKNINIITPPDLLYHDAIEVLLICPSDNVKNEVQQALVDIDDDIDIYVYEPNELLSDKDLDWMINAFKSRAPSIAEIWASVSSLALKSLFFRPVRASSIVKCVSSVIVLLVGMEKIYLQ